MADRSTSQRHHNALRPRHPRTRPQPADANPASQGFSLPLALLVGASALFGTLAILNRALGSNQIRSTESGAIDARDAAEIGMTRIIAELNRPCNRRLLVNTPLLTAADSPGTIAASSFLSSPCEEVGGAPADLTSQQTFNPTGALIDNEVEVPGTDGRIRYTLKRITNDNNANSEFDAFGNANPNFNVTVGFVGDTPQDNVVGRSGTITLDVMGRVVENGATMSTYNLRKTYAVIPKCCGYSFTGINSDGEAKSWGNAIDVPESGCGWASGYGLVLGAKRDIAKSGDRGSLELRNSTIQIETFTGNGADLTNLNLAYCTVPSNGSAIDSKDCELKTAASTASIELIRRDFAMPDVPLPVGSGSSPYTFADSLPTLGAPVAQEDKDDAKNKGKKGPKDPASEPKDPFSEPTSVPGYARLRVCDEEIAKEINKGPNKEPPIWAGDRAKAEAEENSFGCIITATKSETLQTKVFDDWRNASPDTLEWQLGHLCSKVTWNGVPNTIYCSLSSLTIDGATITFDTAGANGGNPNPIILSFPNGGGSSTSSAGTKPFLSSAGSGGTLRHINSSRPGQRPRLQDLSIYGCGPGQNSSCEYQAITSKTDSPLTLDNVFVYAPVAALTSVDSVLVYRGAFWGNNVKLTVTGSSFVIPSGAADGVIANFPAWAALNQLNLAQDYIARTPISVSSF